MASVYSSFVGLTRMLLAKTNSFGGERGKKWSKHFLQGNVNLREIPTRSEIVPLVKETGVFH